MVEETLDPPETEDVTQTPSRPRRSSIPGLIFFGLVLFMLTSHNGDELLARHQYQSSVQSLGYELANYTAWKNGTESNFTMVSYLDKFHSVNVCTNYCHEKPERDALVDPLLSCLEVFAPPLDPHKASYYPNITGFIHGDVVFHNITPSHTAGLPLKPPWSNATEKLMDGLNTTKLLESIGTWNWSGSRKLALSVVEKKSSLEHDSSQDIVFIHVCLSLSPLYLCADKATG